MPTGITSRTGERMNRPSVPTEPQILVLLMPTPREYAAVAGALGAPPEAEPWQVAPVGRLGLAMCGIGKANAAAATAAILSLLDQPRGLICLGVAGSLPGSSAAIGDAVLASPSLFLDEGVQTAADLITCEQLGFPIGPEGGVIAPDRGLKAALAPLAEHAGPVGTVSSCAGTDELARLRGRRALAEAMEGAAAGLAAWRLGAPFAELRVISNTTGARESQIWDLGRALERLATLAAALAAAAS